MLQSACFVKVSLINRLCIKHGLLGSCIRLVGTAAADVGRADASYTGVNSLCLCISVLLRSMACGSADEHSALDTVHMWGSTMCHSIRGFETSADCRLDGRMRFQALLDSRRSIMTVSTVQ